MSHVPDQKGQLRSDYIAHLLSSGAASFEPLLTASEVASHDQPVL